MDKRIELFFLSVALGIIIGIVIGAKATKNANDVYGCDVCLNVPQGKKASVVENNQTTTCIEIK